MAYRVSIIMGLYNCEKYLDVAIQSIINQTYKDWELIICDDGSIDNSLLVAKKYKKKYPDKFLIIENEKNQGLNHTLNRCLKFANGEYIARMDADDISLPTRLEKEVSFLDEHPNIAFVSSKMGTFDKKSEWGETTVIKFPEKHDFCTDKTLFCHAGVMIRREAYFKVKGYTVDPKLLRVEDRHLWFKLYSVGYLGANIDEKLYMMRDDRNAISRRTWQNRINACYVQYIGFKMLKMPFHLYIHIIKYIILEIIKFIIPIGLYNVLHRIRFSNKNNQEII